MSIDNANEAWELAKNFTKLGYLYRANTCLDIAIENLINLSDKTNIKKVLILLTKKIKLCQRAKQDVTTKIAQRKLIKIYLYSTF
ncbi:hypothetical protein [Parapoynx stagnalis nucleopolyhedrovirus]|uniref:Uncharacterized protein n=1 Tax=Parapoynx stagnalis nucleopolyhedrovirus TaxID=2993413 RepID=A0A9E8BWE3_9ABAC|nr:hypothetical protein [Parapoynx stagnalis nucleopolyhedrovirus]